MKKYLNPQTKVNNKDKEKQVGRWSDGFSTSKDGKPNKNVKVNKVDDVIIQDGSVVLMDTVCECATLKGDVSLFSIGGSLVVGNKKMI